MMAMSSTTMMRTEDDDIGIILPNPAALLPRLGDGGNNSFSADEHEHASARGVSRSDAKSARGVSHSDTASTCGGSHSDTASTRGGRKGRARSDAPSMEGAGGGQKSAPSKEGAGGGQKWSHAPTQPFKTPRKSRDNDGKDNGFSFQNMMSIASP
jgi:hypothetical protein